MLFDPVFFADNIHVTYLTHSRTHRLTYTKFCKIFDLFLERGELSCDEGFRAVDENQRGWKRGYKSSATVSKQGIGIFFFGEIGLKEGGEIGFSFFLFLVFTERLKEFF